MDAVFLLWHSHDLGDGETDDKLIGVYSSEAEAEAAKIRKLQYEGFRDAPDGFLIARYELGRDAWSEGYFTWPERTSDATPVAQQGQDSRAAAERVLNVVLRHGAEQDAVLEEIH